MIILSSYHQEFESVSFSETALTLNVTFISVNGREKMVHWSISYNSKNQTRQTLYTLDSRKLILLIVGYSSIILLSWHVWGRHAQELSPLLLSCQLWCKRRFSKCRIDTPLVVLRWFLALQGDSVIHIKLNQIVRSLDPLNSLSILVVLTFSLF